MRIEGFDHSDEARLHDFIEFQYLHNAGLKQFVPPFRATVKEQLDQDTNPFFRYGKGRYFLAKRAKRVVGRIAAFVNPKMDTEDRRAGTVGCFECIDDYLVAAALLDEAFAWLAQNGCNWVCGPMNGSVWTTYRFRIDQHDAEPTFGDPANWPYYPELFSKYGFELSKRWFSRQVDLESKEHLQVARQRHRTWAKRLGRVEEMGYKTRLNDPARFREELRVIHRIADAAFAHHFGVYSLSFEEFEFLFGGLEHLVKKGQILFWLKDGEHQAFMVHCFDYAKALIAMSGNTNLVAKAKFLAHRKRDTLIHLFTAVHPDSVHNRSGLASAMMSESMTRFYFGGEAKRVSHPLMYEGNRSNIYSTGFSRLTGTFGVFEKAP